MADHESHPLHLRRPPLGAAGTEDVSGWTQEDNENTRAWDEHRAQCRLEFGECLRRHVDLIIIIRDGDSGPKDGLRVRAETEYTRGLLAHRQGDVKRAAQHYGAAVTLFDSVRDRKAVAHALTALGVATLDTDPSGALASLQAAAGRLPADPVVQTALGRALWQTGRPRAALAVLDGVLARRGGHPEAKRVKGEILAEFTSKGT